MLVLLDLDWGEGSKPTPARQKFSVTSHLQPVEGGKYPQPPTNRTLVIRPIY